MKKIIIIILLVLVIGIAIYFLVPIETDQQVDSNLPIQQSSTQNTTANEDSDFNHEDESNEVVFPSDIDPSELKEAIKELKAIDPELAQEIETHLQDNQDEAFDNSSLSNDLNSIEFDEEEDEEELDEE